MVCDCYYIHTRIRSKKRGLLLGMYSDDDAGTLLDYDFKDLNQINRATGETVSWNIKPKLQYKT